MLLHPLCQMTIFVADSRPYFSSVTMPTTGDDRPSIRLAVSQKRSSFGIVGQAASTHRVIHVWVRLLYITGHVSRVQMVSANQWSGEHKIKPACRWLET